MLKASTSASSAPYLFLVPWVRIPPRCLISPVAAVGGAKLRVDGTGRAASAKGLGSAALPATPEGSSAEAGAVLAFETELCMPTCKQILETYVYLRMIEEPSLREEGTVEEIAFQLYNNPSGELDHVFVLRDMLQEWGCLPDD